MAAVAVLVWMTLLASCGAPPKDLRHHQPPPPTDDSSAPVAGVAPKVRLMQLVESFPDETSLDHAAIPNADDVWPQMIGSALSTVDICQFYVVSAPGSTLERTIDAIETAVARGVRVRLLVGSKFLESYSETPDRLKRMGVEVRVFSAGRIMGGVLHAKYFVVDQTRAYVGSQNFDWRALTHIQELGLRIEDEAMAHQIQTIFDWDWALADPNAKASEPVAIDDVLPDEQVRSMLRPDSASTQTAASDSTARLMASPRILRPPGVEWDLPKLQSLIEGAQSELRLQLLSYQTSFYGGGQFDTLDTAIRDAVARGVRVRLLVADWLDEEKRRPLEALARIGVEIGVVHIPPHSSGDIPFARVIHAKYMVADGAESWLGTSNFGGDYFYRSRNLSVFSTDALFAAELTAFFDATWQSPYRQNLRLSSP